MTIYVNASRAALVAQYEEIITELAYFRELLARGLNAFAREHYIAEIKLSLRSAKFIRRVIKARDTFGERRVLINRSFERGIQCPRN